MSSITLENVSTITDYALLGGEASTVRNRLRALSSSLKQFFVDRAEIIDLMVLCAVAQEPLLLVGEPGTAKSDIITKFRDALGISDKDYFEYMLTKFTEPSEVFGPIDIAEMKEGRYIRRINGKLPTAKMVFLDEVFKSNSAILNSLLTVINEKKFYQDGAPISVALKILVAATNEIPEQEELLALKDRFTLKAITHSVQENHFDDLIDSGLKSLTDRELNTKPWCQGHASLLDILIANRYMTLSLSQTEKGRDGKIMKDRDRYFPEETFDLFKRLLKSIQRDSSIPVSDRKVVKLYKLLRIHAWLNHGGQVEPSDLAILAHLGETKEQLDILEEEVPKFLKLK